MLFSTVRSRVETWPGSGTEVANALRCTDACVTSKLADCLAPRADARHARSTLCRPGEVLPGTVRPPWSMPPAASGRADPIRMPLKDTPTSWQDPYPTATTLTRAP